MDHIRASGTPHRRHSTQRSRAQRWTAPGPWTHPFRARVRDVVVRRWSALVGPSAHGAPQPEFRLGCSHSSRWPPPVGLQSHCVGALSPQRSGVRRRQSLGSSVGSRERTGRVLVPGSNPGFRWTGSHHLHVATATHPSRCDRPGVAKDGSDDFWAMARRNQIANPLDRWLSKHHA